MARKRKITEDNIENFEEHKLKDTISNAATQNEKVSWNRKLNNMSKLINELRPIEDKLLDLTNIKNELVDKISELRKIMVQDCIHPYEYLVQKDGYFECKFCYKKLMVNENLNG